MSKPIEEILAPKPAARPRIYAYSIDDKAHKGLLKVGQSTRDVKQRVAEQLKTANIKNYKIELDEPAERDEGTTFTDHEVRAALIKKGLREYGIGMDALHAQGRENRPHRVAHRATIHWHARPDLRHACRGLRATTRRSLGVDKHCALSTFSLYCYARHFKSGSRSCPARDVQSAQR